MDFAIKKLKRARGMEGDAFSGDLHVDGKLVASFYNSGTGGPTDVTFARGVDKARQTEIGEAARTRVVAREEARDARERAAAPKGSTHNARGIEWGWYAKHLREQKSPLAALEACIDEMIDDERQLAPMRRAAKSGLVLVKSGKADGRFWTTKFRPGDDPAAVKARAARDGYVIVSDAPESQWLDLIGAT